MSNHTKHPPASFLIPRYNGFYAIERDNQGTVHVTLHALLPTGWQRQQLTPIRVHSPSGLEYGFGGSGPADLSLTILQDFFQEPRARVIEGFDSWAWRLHQDFKWKAIAILASHVRRHVLTLRQVAGILHTVIEREPSHQLPAAPQATISNPPPGTTA